MIMINIFSLNYMMCVEGGWEERQKEKHRQRKRHMYRKMRVEETHQVSTAVKVRVLCTEEEGDRDRGEGKTAREGLNTQHFWSLQNKAPESVTFLLFLWYQNRC